MADLIMVHSLSTKGRLFNLDSTFLVKGGMAARQDSTSSLQNPEGGGELLG